MKKMSLFVAGLALSLSSVALAGTKVDTEKDCCRANDTGCTNVYVAACESNSLGRFCSTDKNDKDGDGSKTDRVVWEFQCADDETCRNTDGQIDCVKNDAECTRADNKCNENDNGGMRCHEGKMVSWTCKEGTTCAISETGFLSCVDPSQPEGDCTAEDNYCSDDKTVGYYCNTKTGTWGRRVQCPNADCTVDEKGGVKCESGSEEGCTSSENYCDPNDKLLGHRCKDGVFIDWTCKAGEKCREGVKDDGTASPGWLSCVKDDGSDPTTPEDCTARCSTEGTLAYNCTDGQEVMTVCQSGTTCKMNGAVAECVAKIDGGGSDDKKDDDDSGCSAAGAGFLLGWMGLAILPALRRREK